MEATFIGNKIIINKNKSVHNNNESKTNYPVMRKINAYEFLHI